MSGLTLLAVPDELVTDSNHPELSKIDPRIGKGNFLRCANYTECLERMKNSDGTLKPLMPS